MSKVFIKERFGVAPNDLLNNPNISLKAKGLYVYMQSKPEDWSFSVFKISSQVKEGEEAVKSGLKELEDFGYLKRTPVKNTDGTWDGYDYSLYSTPIK